MVQVVYQIGADLAILHFCFSRGPGETALRIADKDWVKLHSFLIGTRLNCTRQSTIGIFSDAHNDFHSASQIPSIMTPILTRNYLKVNCAPSVRENTYLLIER